MTFLQKTALFLIPLSLLGAGCGQSLGERALEKALENESGGDVDLDLNDGQVSYTDNEGNVVQYGQNLTLPSDFPKEIPVYKNGLVITTATTLDGTYLTLQTTDTTADVLAWYAGELAEWTKEESFDLQGLSARTYTKPGMKLGLSVTGQDGQTAINLQLSQQK